MEVTLKSFSLSRGKAKLENQPFWKFLKAQNYPEKTVEFVIKKIHPRPEKLTGITMVFELETPVNNCDAFPVSKTNYLMIAQSWPDDNSESLIGCIVRCRAFTTHSKTDGRPYSRFHIYEIQKPGKGSKPVPIKELPRQQEEEPTDDQLGLTDDDVPF